MGTSKELASSDGANRWTFYYDGDCGLCCWSVNLARRIDLLGSVRWVPFQSLEAPPAGLSWGDLDQAAYLDTGQGKLFPGFYAFKKLSLRLPLLWPLAPIFWFPGMHVPGTVIYRWVAANRYRLSRCGFSGSKSKPGH